MAFTWKRLSLFGLVLSIPAIVFLVKKISDEQAMAFEAHKDALMACTSCHRLFIRFPVRLMRHLEEEHGLCEDDSMNLVNDLYRRYMKARHTRRDV